MFEIEIVIRTLLGILALYIPGHLLISALFPREDELTLTEQVALSIGMSMVIVSILGLVLIYTVGLNLETIVFSLLFVIIFLSICAYIRGGLSYERFRKGFRSINTNFLNNILIIILIVILISIIRFIPATNYAVGPIHYDGPASFMFKYLLVHGKFPEKNLPVFSLYSQGLNEVRAQPVLIILHVVFQLLTGLPSGDLFSQVHVVAELRYAVISMLLSIMVVSTALSITNSSSNLYLKNVTSFEKILITLFSISGSSVVLMYLSGWNAGFGFAFISLCVYILLLLCRKTNDLRFKLLLLIFSSYLILLYHTAALVYGIVSIILLVYSFKNQKIKILRLYTTSYLITFTAYLLYVYVSFFGTIMGGVKQFVTLLLLGQIKIDVVNPRTPFEAFDPIYLGIYALSIIAGSSPLALFVLQDTLSKVLNSFSLSYKGKTNLNQEILEKHVFRILIISLVISFFVWFVYMGRIGLIHRGKEYTSYFSILTFSYLIGTHIPKKLNILLKVSILIAIITSIYVYSGSVEHRLHLTYSEKTSQEWLKEHIPPYKTIFTDLRLSANFVSDGYFKVIGPLDPPKVPDDILINRLNAIFYGNNSTKAIKTLKSITTKTGENFDYLFFSERFTQIGIYGYDYLYKPAPFNFTIKYDQSELNKVYYNGIVYIYSK